MDKAHKEEEIDLLALLLKGVNVIRSNFRLIVIFFLIGTGLGLAYYFSVAKVYKSSMVVSSDILTKSFAENLIANLNRHRREGNLKALTVLLNIDEKTAININRFQIESISEIEDQKESERFLISVDVLDTEILPALQQGLIHFLENNDYVKVRVAEDISFLNQMISKVDAEIKDIETFKQKLVNGEFFRSVNGNVMFDPTDVNSKIIALTKEKLELEYDLQLVSSVQVIEGFVKFQKPSSPKLSVSLISGSAVGLFFVAILLAFKSIRKILRMADIAEAK